MDKVTITISGATGTGKTALAYAIADLLDKHSIYHKITDLDADYIPTQIGSQWGKVISYVAKNVEINIITTQEIRKSFYDKQ